MKFLLRLTARVGLLLALLSSAACLSSDVLVMVRPDGSGTITHTVKRFKSGWAALDSTLIASDPAHPKGSQPITENDVRTAAKAFGKGVELLSTSPLVGDDIEGRTSVYAFQRIQDVAVDLMPTIPGEGNGFWSFDGIGVMPGATLGTNLTFNLESGDDGTRLLTVHFPEDRLDPSVLPPYEEKAEASSPEELAVLRAMMRNARIDITIRTSTALLGTNSPHREGNRVTLMSLDLERMVLSDEINKLQAFRPGSMDEVRWALHDLPGAKLALDREITLEFSGPPPQPPAVAPAAQTAPPDTEIVVASLAVDGDALKLGNLVNISNNSGYDNQPSFTPDGRAILFTSARSAARGAAGAARATTDIYRFDLTTNTLRQVTSTPESEYSPTVMPDGRHISVVRVEADGTQRLWRFTLDGSEPALVLADVKPVGYHAWIDDRQLALFVLGEPATLQLADRSSGTADVIAKGIGRSLQRIPNGGISYVQVDRASGEHAARSLTIMELDPSTRATRVLVPAVQGATEADLGWMPNGTLLMAHDGTLYSWRRGRASWTAAADLAALGLRGVTRLAVSPSGDRIAIVAQAGHSLKR